MDQKELVQKKRELDKHILNCVRTCILNEEQSKVMTYLDLLHFSQSIKLVVKLCNSLGQHDLARQVSIFISDKEAQEIMQQQYKKTPVAQALDSRQVSLCMQMKSAQNEQPDDLSKFSVVNKQNEKKYEI